MSPEQEALVRIGIDAIGALKQSLQHHADREAIEHAARALRNEISAIRANEEVRRAREPINPPPRN